jgi:hypothetical protein
VGLEPTLAEANTALNRARLPIPPLRRRKERRFYRQFPCTGKPEVARPTTSHNLGVTSPGPVRLNGDFLLLTLEPIRTKLLAGVVLTGVAIVNRVQRA